MTGPRRHVTRTPLGLVVVTEEIPIILGTPVDTTGLPAEVQRLVRQSVSVQHSLSSCSKCRRAVWIGPTQKEMIATAHVVLLCAFCIIDEYDEMPPMISLNPDIDNVPRRT